MVSLRIEWHWISVLLLLLLLLLSRDILDGFQMADCGG